ncbi:MAG: hypothetical protein HY209_00555 [Candidatus Omnitrophica bacterium]|nr:hypothetical protein [Candidatus Omnitrophota bacterium]
MNLMTGYGNQRISWPLLFFLCYALVILGVTVYLQPGWGFMDDAHGLDNAQDFWSGKRSLSAMIAGDIHSFGRFRPLYYLWVVCAYAIKAPVMIYLFVTVIGFGALLAWGRIITHIFPDAGQDIFTRYVYPLVFFAFTPFWNIFMYVSVQEKFVYLFGTAAIYVLLQAYRKESLRGVFLSLGLVILAMAGKEIGLALIASFFVFAVADWWLIGLAPRLSRWMAAISGTVLIGYIFLIRLILGGYTAGYKDKMNVVSMVKAALAAPLMIKGIFCVALVTIAAYFILSRTRRAAGVKPYFLIMPLFVLAYMVILLPWRFANYLLAPLAPFLGVSVYLFFVFVCSIHPKVAAASRFLVIVLTVIILINVIIPRISKMADKRKIVAALVDLRQVHPRAKFFYPPPMMETFEALRYFSGADIVYAGKMEGGMLAKCVSSCYLLINDEAAPMELESVVASQGMYTNGTWAIYHMDRQEGAHAVFKPDFVGNHFYYLISRPKAFVY